LSQARTGAFYRRSRCDLSDAMGRGAEAENAYWILDTVEMKTAWHPIGL